MAFIDDEFFELPNVATEEEAEGGGSQSQYSQQSQGGESEGSQSSQGSRRTPRRAKWNRIATERFLDRLFASNSYKEVAAGTDTDTPKTPTTATKMERGARTKRCPTAQQSQGRASNHPKRAIQTKAARQTTNSQ